jgi:hypothetical protein
LTASGKKNGRKVRKKLRGKKKRKGNRNKERGESTKGFMEEGAIHIYIERVDVYIHKQVFFSFFWLLLVLLLMRGS